MGNRLSPFPHWTLSTQTGGKRYAMLTLPASDWYVTSEIGQSDEAGHNSGTIHALVDYYYNLGALINLYSHSSSDGTGLVGPLVQDYIRYSLGKSRVWSTNELGVYQWWLKRSGVQVTPTFSTTSNQASAVVSISGASDPQTAVEVLIPRNDLHLTGSFYQWSGGLGRHLSSQKFPGAHPGRVERDQRRSALPAQSHRAAGGIFGDFGCDAEYRGARGAGQ